MARVVVPSSDKFEISRKYWEEKLTSDLEVINLPTDYGESETYEKGAYNAVVDNDLKERLELLTKGQDSLLLVVMISALKTLLFKYTDRDDITIGIPVLNSSGGFNTFIAIRDRIDGEMTFRELLMKVKTTVSEGFKNQHYPLDNILELLEFNREEPNLFKVLLCIDSISSDTKLTDELLAETKNEIAFSFAVSNGSLGINISYNAAHYRQETIMKLWDRYSIILGKALEDMNKRICDIDILDKTEQKTLLLDFNNTSKPFPEGMFLHRMFEEMVDRYPDNEAIIFNDQVLTYREVEKRANRIANYLVNEAQVKENSLVGIFHDDPLEVCISIIGVLKSGAAYVPMDPSYPEERLRTLTDDAGIEVVISGKRFIKTLNRLQWDSPSVRIFLLTDSHDVYGESEEDVTELMKETWEFIGQKAVDDIEGGSWVSSFTGENLSFEEMEEYSQNVLKKLMPYLDKDTRVLEIGCASGLSMYKIAPLVGMYYGTDLSQVIINKNLKRLEEEGHNNIKLGCMAAHEIDSIEEKDFDIVIINSVIQCFSGYNYTRKVFNKILDKIKDNGLIFVGDIMDLDRRAALSEALIKFKEDNEGKGYRTKTDYSIELFFKKEFFEDLRAEFPAVKNIEFSDKIHTIENELTRFRYDAVLFVDKKQPLSYFSKFKMQHDLREVEKQSDQRPEVKIAPENLAYIIYTSGTTGKPKGVMVEHRGIANSMQWRREEYALEVGDTGLQVFSYCFDGFIAAFFTPIVSGARIVLLDYEDAKSPVALKSSLVKNKVTHFVCVPSLYAAVLECMTKEDMTSMRYVTLAGEKTGIALVKKTKELNENTRIVNEYGPTECSVVATFKQDMMSDEPVTIGKPIANTQIYITDRNSSLKPIGVTGELCIGGKGLARGYLKRPELTKEKFIDNPCRPGEKMYRTGDLARWLPDGNIEFIGRCDEQVKVRGFRIELGEIEARLLENKNVKEAVVLVKDGTDGNKFLCAYLVCENEMKISDIREYLSKSLPHYMIPEHFIQLDKMPLTPNGKVNKKALPQPKGVINTGVRFVAPRDRVEEALCEMWKEILGLEKVGVNDSFFDLGGHSLKATTFISRVHKAFNIELPLREMFRTPTIACLAEYIKNSVETIYSEIKPVEEKEYYPQSSAQKRMYILSQFEGSEGSYHMPSIFKVEGSMDKDRVENAFLRLIERHESLRTSFHMIDNKPVQKIHKEVDFKFEYYNLSNEEEKDLKAKELTDGFVRKFDIEKAPLMRAGLIDISENEQVFMFDIHHIISDGISMQLLMKEFYEYYEGKEPEPLKLQYKDFSEWQNSLFEKGVIKKQAEYWKNVFEGEIPVLNLPTDYPRPSYQSFEGDRVVAFADEMLKDDIMRLGRETGATLYMLLLAAYNVLLYRLTGQEDIVVGSPIAGRPHADLENIIGVFINTLAMRNRPEGSKTFREFLNEVKDNSLKAYENQEYQFEELIENVGVKRDMGRNPLFDTMFILQNALEEDKSEKEEDPDFTSYDMNYNVSKFDMSLKASEKEDSILFIFEYCIKLFNKDTIQRFSDIYLNILKKICRDPDAVLADLDIIPEDERERILESFNNTFKHYNKEKTFHVLFEEQVTRTPENKAVAFKDESLTYRELNNKANQLARRLRQKGVKPGTALGDSVQNGSIVGILADQGIETVVGILGVLKAGGAYLPIEPGYPEERIRFMLEDSGAKVLLTSRNNTVKISFGIDTIYLNNEYLYVGDDSNLEPVSLNSDLAYTIYTSGTTGKPKGVMIDNSSLVNYLTWFTGEFGIDNNDSTAILSSLCFDLGYTAFFSALLKGAELHLIDKQNYKDPEYVLEYIKSNRITYLKTTPSMFSTIVNTFSFSVAGVLNSLRLVAIGGEKINMSDIERFNRLYPKAVVLNHYGPTEATIGCIAYPIDFNKFEEFKECPVIGRPISNIQAYVINKNLKLQPIGVPGELAISGDCLARGYLSRPELE
ncbi:MAG: amino acid adenylation domain-containing protein, partial [Clostridiaceae bacterium]|nr:amino acid adenylation domain-containing protein [Clostridiaceae bacterium]